MLSIEQAGEARTVYAVTMFVVAPLAVLFGMGPLADGLEPPLPSAEAKLPGWRPYQDYVAAPFKSPAEGVELLYKAIKEEIRDPTKSSQHDAHWIEHHSILGSLAYGMGDRAREGRDGELKLRYLLAAETNQEVKDLLVIALGCFGDKNVWEDLVRIMKGNGRLPIREYAARSLSESNARLAIPDLIEALEDPAFIVEDVPATIGTGGPNVRMPVFRVRAMAFAVLGHLGVKVAPLHKPKPFELELERRVRLWTVNPIQKTKPFEFEVDEESAVNALKSELRNEDKEHVAQAIAAIARVGGTAAKTELKRFIQEHEHVLGNENLVSKAKEALSRMDADKK